MMKKLILPIFALYMFTHVGCSSSDVQDESADVAASDDESFAEEGEGDFADGEEASGEETADAGDEASDEEADEEGGEETADAGDEAAEGDEELEMGEDEEEVADAGDAPKDEAAPAADAGEDDEELAMDEGDEESEFPEEVADETAVAAAPEGSPTDESLFTADNGGATETAKSDPVPEPAPSPTDDLFKPSPVASAAPTSYAPLLKIKDAPFDRGGALLNRVYLARSGDTLKSISEKIYGSDRAKDLQKWNPGVRKSPRVGDKVYYSSPREPQDSSRMLTYYEDVGVAPQIHTTKDGDNIRTLGSSLLGNKDSWKELWSTNLDIASKGALPAGVDVKYWPESSAPAPAPVPTLAETTPAQPTDPTAVPPADLPPADPSQNVAANTMPPTTDPTLAPAVDPVTGLPPTTAPEPLPGDLAGQDPNTGQVSSPDGSAPPAMVGTTEPPPAAPIEADPVKKKGPAPAEVANASDDMMMMLGVCAVALILLVGVFVIMKKNRARQIDLSQTQV